MSRVVKYDPNTQTPLHDWEEQASDDGTPEAQDTDPSGMQIEEQEDGSALVFMPEKEERPTEDGFDDNLAKLFSRVELQTMGAEIIEYIERDKESRKKRDEQYQEGLRRTGLGDEAPGGADFHGASKVVHPVLAESCVDFEAHAIKELMPAAGPVKTNLLGRQDDDRLKLAEKKRDILNWQLTKQIVGYRDEFESLLSQLPMGGSQYKKLYWKNRAPCSEFVPIDDVYLPFHTPSFYAAHRITIKQDITRAEFERRIAEGLYLDQEESGIDLPSETPMPEMSKAEEATAKIEGKDESEAYSIDGLRRVYECYIYRSIDEDSVTGGDYSPYIIHIDEWTKEVVGIYRNWEENDEDRTALPWLVEYGFIPWRGAYKIGLPHLIGSLYGALTGALRALLDSAHISNAPTLVKLRQGRMVGQTTDLQVTQIQEIDGPASIDDIRKVMMAIPFNGPSPVLLQLLGILTDSAKGVVSTAEEKIADASNEMPVGTSLALIEQGSKVFSAIHMRLHASLQKELEIICRLNAKYLDREDLVKAFGEDMPDPAELFSTTDDIVPASDPNIFSEAQRYAQMQAVLQIMQDQRVQWNINEAYTRILRLLNVPEPEKLLPAQRTPQKLDAIQENASAMFGNPLAPYQDQDHLAHIETHLRFILNPMLGAGPAFAGPQLAPLLQHCTQHLSLFYPQLASEAKALALSTGHLLPDAHPDLANAVAGHAADDMALQRLNAIMEMWKQAQQVIQSKMPPPPMDPQAQVTMQVAQMEDARQKVQLQQDAQRDQGEFQLKQSQQQFDQQLAQFKVAQDERFQQLEAQLKEALNAQDNHQKQVTELLKNREDNQTQIIVEQMRHAMKEIFPSMMGHLEPKPEHTQGA